MAASVISSICFLLLAVCLNITPSVGESVTAIPCKQKGEPYDLACSVSDLTVVPCAEAAENLPCKVKHNSNATITFNYIADFNAPTVNTRAYWDKSIVDLPFIGMNTDGCEFTKCPVAAGKKETYSYSLLIQDKYPVGEYLVKWRIWNKEENKQCCLKLKINIVP